jgi:hypothetical protein
MKRHLPGLSGFTAICFVILMAPLRAGGYRPSDLGLALFGGAAIYGTTYICSDEFLDGDDDGEA